MKKLLMIVLLAMGGLFVSSCGDAEAEEPQPIPEVPYDGLDPTDEDDDDGDGGQGG